MRLWRWHTAATAAFLGGIAFATMGTILGVYGACRGSLATYHLGLLLILAATACGLTLIVLSWKLHIRTPRHGRLARCVGMASRGLFLAGISLVLVSGCSGRLADAGVLLMLASIVYDLFSDPSSGVTPKDWGDGA